MINTMKLQALDMKTLREIHGGTPVHLAGGALSAGTIAVAAALVLGPTLYVGYKVYQAVKDLEEDAPSEDTKEE